MVRQREKIRTILGLCARMRGHRAMYEMLGKEVEAYIDRQFCLKTLIQQAERQGVAPLLYTHISAIDLTLPGGQHRILRSLYQRSRYANQKRNRVMTEILAAFNAEGIDVFLVKGIALANTVYEEGGLRPMRDIDLLIRKTDVESACSTLAEHGFSLEPDHQIPHDYYHLPPMHKRVNGLPVSIELHHELMPRQASYPVWTYDSFSHAPRSFPLGGKTAFTINLEASLYYLYLHGLKAPLTYEPFRLIHVADLISLTEMYCGEINWDQLKAMFPRYKTVFSQLHFISPWRDEHIKKLQLEIPAPPRTPPQPYHGWPLVKIKETPPGKLPKLLKETLLPSPWWLRTYYGHAVGLSYYKALFFEHPRTVWRWIKTYTQAYFYQP